LNHYPEVASFVRDSGHADRYRDLKVNYVNHHNPDLILFDGEGDEVQRIDLTRLKTTANIHKLCKMLGMQEQCRDLNKDCTDWQRTGQCDANPSFMLVNCRKSCGVCAEDATNDDSIPCANTSPDSDCEYWSTMGECEKNEAFMTTACARSCGVCTRPEDRPPPEEDEFDDFGKDEL